MPVLVLGGDLAERLFGAPRRRQAGFDAPALRGVRQFEFGHGDREQASGGEQAQAVDGGEALAAALVERALRVAAFLFGRGGVCVGRELGLVRGAEPLVFAGLGGFGIGDALL